MAFLLIPAAGALVGAGIGAAGAGIKWLFSGSPEPNHAPGPTKADLEAEAKARKEAEEAQKKSAKQAEEAQAKLKKIEDENRRKEEEKRNYPLPDFLKKEYGPGKLNIAVTGNSGVGKSSFINYIRECKKKDPGFAATGSSECTMEPTLYQAKSGDNIWDLPGAGTPKFPQETYMKTTGIRYFDVVILITADRFTEAEDMLKKELDEKCVPCIVVRNKADVTCEAKILEEEEAEEEELSDERKQEIRNEVVQSIRDYFKKEYKIHDICVISTQAKFKKHFDHEKLLIAIEEDCKRSRMPA